MSIFKVMKLFLTVGLIFVITEPYSCAAEIIGNRTAVTVGDIALSEADVARILAWPRVYRWKKNCRA